MKITVYSSKGGAGKTPIATNIILDREYAVGCNERENVYEDFLDDDLIFPLDLSESFPDFPSDIDIVFDLGGAISNTSHSITSAIKQSDLVIVPIEDEYKSIKKGLETLREINAIEDFNGNILVVATKLEKAKKESFKPGQWKESEAFKRIQSSIEGHGFKVPMLPLKYSKVFNAIFEQELSIKQLMEADPLAKYNYREVAAQFDLIYKAIDLAEGGSHAKQEQSRSTESA